jgi:heat shock protein HtpX
MNLYQNIAKNKRRTVIYIIIFFIFVGFIGWFFDQYYQGGGVGIFFALLFTIPTALTSYYASDKVALAVNGAKAINPDNSSEEKQLYRLVENVAITAGIPVPKIHIIPDDAMNAFATGRDPKHASIAFTTGILAKLDKLELEGVIAHELSHIKNYDIRLSTVIVVLVGLIALLSDFFLRWGWFGGRRRSNNNDSGGGILMIVGIILVILSPIIAQLISLAVSRRREFLADSSGALLTRYPEGLAKALQKISQDSDPLDHANNATMHLYIANPVRKRGGNVSKFFSTHPPIEERIQALLGMDLKKFEKEYLGK